MTTASTFVGESQIMHGWPSAPRHDEVEEHQVHVTRAELLQGSLTIGAS